MFRLFIYISMMIQSWYTVWQIVKLAVIFDAILNFSKDLEWILGDF